MQRRTASRSDAKVPARHQLSANCCREFPLSEVAKTPYLPAAAFLWQGHCGRSREPGIDHISRFRFRQSLSGPRPQACHGRCRRAGGTRGVRSSLRRRAARMATGRFPMSRQIRSLGKRCSGPGLVPSLGVSRAVGQRELAAVGLALPGTGFLQCRGCSQSSH